VRKSEREREREREIPPRIDFSKFEDEFFPPMMDLSWRNSAQSGMLVRAGLLPHFS
jgi:hypothetical protein